MDAISNKVIHYGRFKEALDRIVDLMRSEHPSSVIIRGNPGSGKKTVIQEAVKLTEVNCVSISPEQYNDDYTAIRDIATDLGFHARGSNIPELINEIRENASGGDKLVIVLEDFEDLCSQRQSLLYNLMNLIHTNPTKVDKGPNLTLIGLTCSLEWAENIEKRVRSRLNAKCIDLKLPYSSLKEYIEFASLLLGGCKIKKEFSDQLEYMYWFTNRSVRSLKKYLLKICDLNVKKKKKLVVVDFDPDDYHNDYQILHNNLLRERLRHLTRPQLDLVKYAVYYCFQTETNSFTLARIAEASLKWHGIKPFDNSSEKVLRDTALLVKLRLFKPEKPEQVIGFDAVMFPAVVSNQFKIIIDGDLTLHHLSTDSLWKKLT